MESNFKAHKLNWRTQLKSSKKDRSQRRRKNSAIDRRVARVARISWVLRHGVAVVPVATLRVVLHHHPVALPRLASLVRIATSVNRLRCVFPASTTIVIVVAVIVTILAPIVAIHFLVALIATHVGVILVIVEVTTTMVASA